MRQFNFTLRFSFLFSQWTGLDFDLRKQGTRPSPFGVSLLCTAVLCFVFLFNFCMRSKDSFKIELTAQHVPSGCKRSPLFFSSPSFLSSSTLGLFATFLWLATFFLPPSPSSSESENSSSQAILLSVARTETKQDTIWHEWQQQIWLQVFWYKCLKNGLMRTYTFVLEVQFQFRTLEQIIWYHWLYISIACFCFLLYYSTKLLHVRPSKCPGFAPGLLSCGQAQNTFSWTCTSLVLSPTLSPSTLRRKRIPIACHLTQSLSHQSSWQDNSKTSRFSCKMPKCLEYISELI